MKNKKRISALYITFDVIAAIITWCCFFIFRTYNVDHSVSSERAGYYAAHHCPGNVNLLLRLHP